MTLCGHLCAGVCVCVCVCVCMCVCARICVHSYFASEEHKSGQPPEGLVGITTPRDCGCCDHCSSRSDLVHASTLGKVFDDPPFPIDESTVLIQPFSLKQVSPPSTVGCVLFGCRQREEK